MHGIKDSASAVAGWVTELDHESGYNFYVLRQRRDNVGPEVLVKIEEEQLKIEEEKTV